MNLQSSTIGSVRGTLRFCKRLWVVSAKHGSFRRAASATSSISSEQTSLSGMTPASGQQQRAIGFSTKRRLGFDRLRRAVEHASATARRACDVAFVANTLIPMVAPGDLRKVAADRLLSSSDDTGVPYAKGPKRYSSSDVAKAFSDALGQPVELTVTPRYKGRRHSCSSAFRKPLRIPTRE